MTLRTLVIGLATSVMVASGGHAATLKATFDSDPEGWTGNPGEGAVTHVASGGNPAGHIRVTDIGGGANNGFASGALAGANFLGDLTAFDGGVFSIDMATFAGGGPTFSSYGQLILSSGANIAAYDFAAVAPAPGGWQSYAFTFDAATFGVSQSDWLTILSDVTLMGISTDAFDGGDTIGLDNVMLASTPSAAVPLPATAVLMIMALMGFGVLRKRQGGHPRALCT